MRALARAVWSALRELTGEADYDRYLERHAACRPGTALDPGQYWQARWRSEDQPGARCC